MILLVLAGMIWGMGFVAVKWALPTYSPLWISALRFLVAGIISLPFFFYFRTYKKSLKSLKWALWASFFSFITLTTQTVGLKYTTVAKSGFITCLYVFFTPLIESVIFKRKIPALFWALAGVALVGVMFLCELQLSSFNFGDFLTLICALAAAMQIVAVGKIMNDFDSGLEMNVIQTLGMMILALPLAFFMEGAPSAGLAPFTALENYFTPGAVWGILFVGIFSSFIAFWIQAHAQKKIESHVVGLIFLLESPFAVMWGKIFLGESLTVKGAVGATLILLSVGVTPFLIKVGKE